MTAGGKGRTAVVIATGPSLTQEDVTLACEKSDLVVAVNDAWRLLPMQGRGCHLYAADPAWWQYHIDDVLEGFQGECWTQDKNWKPGAAEELGLTVVKSRGEPGLSKDPEWLHQGQNSGYQAINLAYHLGASRIVLTGFDMSRDNGKGHFFGEHPKGLIQNTTYEHYLGSFRTIRPADYGIEIINCTRRTKIDCFPIMDLAEVF